MKCIRCNQEKSLTEFYKRKDTVKRYGNICKKCILERTIFLKKNNPEKYKKYDKKYRQTRKGKEVSKQATLKYRKKYPWISIYSNMAERCKNNKYYKKIKVLMTLEDVKLLWKRDNAYKMKCPSIDRINSKKDYTILNCRFIEKSENMKRAHLGKIENGKSVVQLNLDGKEIRRFCSQLEAQRQTGIKHQYISLAVKSKKQLAGGYLWQRF